MLSVSNKIPQQYIYQLDGDGKITGKQEIAGGHFTQMDTVNFKEYYDAKLKERQAELAGAPDLPRITLDVPMYEFYPTGDPVMDQEIQLGINYKKPALTGQTAVITTSSPQRKISRECPNSKSTRLYGKNISTATARISMMRSL